ncbi:MAG TPA: Rrf2 family transcriptional regulator [Hyphomicrobiales bacterium]|nr:Rrf2 family transcriptional regulator [Hyphomicrobiales bacterium]
MQLSTKGRYAVMAMVELAKHGDAGALPLAMIADSQKISIAYLEQLFLKLRRAGLVIATRGPKGGYRLARTPDEITIAEIMDAADEQVRMNRCAVEGTDWCLGTKRCMTHDLWRALGDHIGDFLVGVSLQDVLDQKFAKSAAAAGAANKDIAARS